MDQVRSKNGSKYASMDFYTNSTFQVQKGRGLAPQFRNLGPLYNF